MREQEYKDWLLLRGLSEKSIGNKISYLKRIESYYGSLEECFKKDECASILTELTYSVQDEIENNLPKHKLEIAKEANIRTATASYKTSLNSYISFLREFLTENDNFVIADSRLLKVKENLKTVGKATFVKYYSSFKEENRDNIITKFSENKEKWKKASKATKASAGIRIFNENNHKLALNMIISSCGVDEEVVLQANKIFNEEFENEEMLNYRFIKAEFSFGEDIIRKLFSNYRIESQYPVLNYKIDWYIPELKLAIEFDEKHHKKNEKLDYKRQKEIEKKLGCKFLRYDYT
ncbi:DUF559 domain-containing protein [uncultured Tenacibaculum sp.]|uniref:DUF559 domain-containing protein n=1 Tax=uncultured Tenacibaculum sp. TaxID=174713 RepID=UPI00262DC5A6|nr:DUF559 domain-containing protein [uncultured Tenacibaculum sp.]